MLGASELLRTAGFDLETIEMICKAYVRSRRPVGDISRPDPINETIAMRILSLAKQGERDLDRLCTGALKSVIGR